MKVFCIDGVIVEIDHEPTRAELESQVLMPIEDQPIMAGHLGHLGVTMLSPETGSEVVARFGGVMVEDRNTETFADVTESLTGEREEWPKESRGARLATSRRTLDDLRRHLIRVHEGQRRNDPEEER